MPYTIDKDGNIVKTEAPKKPTVDNMRALTERAQHAEKMFAFFAGMTDKELADYAKSKDFDIKGKERRDFIEELSALPVE